MSSDKLLIEAIESLKAMISPPKKKVDQTHRETVQYYKDMLEAKYAKKHLKNAIQNK